jgi:hypothetical protein
MLHLLLLSLALADAKPWDPIPPCVPPFGVVQPAVEESMCSHVVAQSSNIVVREYGLPKNATLVTVHVDSPDYYLALTAGLQLLLQYFSGDNTEQKNILSSRTVPITVRNLRDLNLTWAVSMMVSTASFPDDSSIPAPSLPVELENVGQRSIAVLQFNTTVPPVADDFATACGNLLNSPLPKGYTFNTTSSWSLAYVLYNGEWSTFFTNECWAEVVHV